MKTLLFSLFLVGNVSAATCNKKIDPSKVVLFIDTNMSSPEIATAEKAACDRGEKLVMVPKNYKEFEVFIRAIDKANADLKKCKSNCKAFETAKEKSFEKFESFKKANPDLSKATSQVVDEIAKSQGKIQQIIISGHDGGGVFSGEKGGISRPDLYSILDEHSATNDVTSLLLLGCYTGTQKEVFDWKKVLPNVRLIGGYDASAPLSDRPHGHKYLADLMLKGKDLLAQTDIDKLNKYTEKNIKSLFGLHSALYLQCEETSNEKDFYYSKAQNPSEFTKLDFEACLKDTSLQQAVEKLVPYEFGELEPPKDTQKGELRKLYSTVRQWEHCIDIVESPAKVSTFFNLLFYEDVKKSFAHYYKDRLAEAEAALARLDVATLEVNAAAEIEALEKELQAEKDVLKLLSEKPQDVIATLEAAVTKAEQDRNAFINSFRFTGLKKFIGIDGTITQQSGKYFSKEELKLIDQYKEINGSLGSKKLALAAEKNEPGTSLRLKTEAIAALSNKVSEAERQLFKIKKDPELLKKAWIPTSANLAKKTRKETLSNLNAMTELELLPGIPKELKKELEWVRTTTAKHLQRLDNPTSWHAFNGVKVETPPADVKVMEIPGTSSSDAPLSFESKPFGSGLLFGQ